MSNENGSDVFVISYLNRLQRCISRDGFLETSRLVLRRFPSELRRAYALFGETRVSFRKNALFPLRNHLLLNRPVKVQVADVAIKLQPSGAEACNVWSGARFEQFEIAFVLSVLKGGMTFFDVGANSGIFSIAAAKKTPRANVYAFEQTVWTFRLLQDNISLNSLPSVTPVHTALGDRIGVAEINLNALGKDGMNTLGQPTHLDSHIVGQETVPITTLDAFVQANGIDRVDVMKVDVEGCELHVFQGGRGLLQRVDAPLILYEGYSWCTKGFGYHPVETMWLLQDYGYSLFVLDSQTGMIAPRQPAHGYDAMILAAKPTHFSRMWGAVG